MNLLFVCDPLASFNIQKDSTYAMMREALARGHRIFATQVNQVHWSQRTGVVALMQAITLITHTTAPGDQPASSEQRGWQGTWFEAMSPTPQKLADFDVVLMRKDPPFDAEYTCCTHLLEQAEREGALVLNRPLALRNTPEKLALMRFSHLTAPTLVARDMGVLKAFHAEHRDVIFKPLDGMGGMGIFRVKADGLNLGAIMEQLTADGTRAIMAQAFLPAIEAGDKRVLLIDGEPLPYCLARIPQNGEVRGNLAAGGRGEARPLTDDDRRIAQALGPTLADEGLFLVGLDVIGDTLTEINVTSPTCFQEITAQTGFDVAACFMDALERRIIRAGRRALSA